MKAKNLRIFKETFSNEGPDFAEWLEDHFIQGRIYPFAFKGRDLYDLGDLFADLVAGLAGDKENLSKIIDAIKKALQPVRHGFDHARLADLSEIVAKAGLVEISGEIAKTVDGLLCSFWVAQENNSDFKPGFDLLINLDRTFASLAGLAMETTDADVLRVCQKLFEDQELAMFSSILFAPVAVNNFKNWGIYWDTLLDHSTAKMEIFGIDPAELNEVHTLRQAGGEKIAAHFNLEDSIHKMLAYALHCGYSLQGFFDFGAALGVDKLQLVVELLLCDHNPAIGYKWDSSEYYVLRNWLGIGDPRINQTLLSRLSAKVEWAPEQPSSEEQLAKEKTTNCMKEKLIEAAKIPEAQVLTPLNSAPASS